MENVKYAIEAIFLAYAEPIEIEKISEVLEISKDEIEKLIKELTNEYEENKRGFRIIKIKNKYQMVTNSLYHESLEKLFENVQRQNLSQAALEVLAIIAYNQPVTKGKIESIRGVNSDKAISRLLEKNIIEEVGRLDVIGKPIVFGTTSEFLRLFGLETLESLPPIEEFREIIEVN